ncbi:MAG: hypothetical protein V4629_10575 [Pseudomonadota bacterium]
MISSNYIRPFNVVSTFKAAISVAFLTMISSARSQASAFTNVLTNSTMRTSPSTQALTNITSRNLQAQGASQTIAGLSTGEFVVLDQSGAATLLGITGSKPLNLTDKNGKAITGTKVFPNVYSKHSNPAFAVQSDNAEMHNFEIRDGIVTLLSSLFLRNCADPTEIIQNFAFLLNENVTCNAGFNTAGDKVVLNSKDVNQPQNVANIVETKTSTENVYTVIGEDPKLVYTNYGGNDKTSIGEYSFITESLPEIPEDPKDTCFREWGYLNQYALSKLTPFAQRIAANKEIVVGVVGENSSQIIRFSQSFSEGITNVTVPVSLNITNPIFAATAKAVYLYSPNDKALYQVPEDNIPRKMDIDLGKSGVLAVSESPTATYITNGVDIFEFSGIAQTDAPTPAPTAVTSPGPIDAEACSEDAYSAEIQPGSTFEKTLPLIPGNDVHDMTGLNGAYASFNNELIEKINQFDVGNGASIITGTQALDVYRVENEKCSLTPSDFKVQAFYSTATETNEIILSYNRDIGVKEGIYEMRLPIQDNDGEKIGEISIRINLKSVYDGSEICTLGPFQIEILSASTTEKPLPVQSGEAVFEMDSKCECARAAFNEQIIAQIQSCATGNSTAYINMPTGETVPVLQYQNGEYVPSDLTATASFDSDSGLNSFEINYDASKEFPATKLKVEFPITDINSNPIGKIGLEVNASGKKFDGGGKGGLTTGEIVGIALGSAAGLGLIITTVYCYRKKRTPEIITAINHAANLAVRARYDSNHLPSNVPLPGVVSIAINKVVTTAAALRTHVNDNQDLDNAMEIQEMAETLRFDASTANISAIRDNAPQIIRDSTRRTLVAAENVLRISSKNARVSFPRLSAVSQSAPDNDNVESGSFELRNMDQVPLTPRSRPLPPLPQQRS